MHPNSRRAIALPTALMLAAFLLVAAIGYLTVVEHNLRFQHRENLHARAFYLALSGIDYYILAKVDRDPSLGPGSAPLRLYPSPNEVIVMWEEPGVIRSTGIIWDSTGRVLAKRMVAQPQAPGTRVGAFSNRMRTYDVQL